MASKTVNIKKCLLEISADFPVKISQKQADEVVQAIFGVIAEKLEQGEAITVPGFGKFRIKESKEREGRNPKTGETMTIPAKRTPAFTPAKALKEQIAL